MAMTFGEPSVPGWDPLIEPQATQTKVMQMLMMIEDNSDDDNDRQ